MSNELTHNIAHSCRVFTEVECIIWQISCITAVLCRIVRNIKIHAAYEGAAEIKVQIQCTSWWEPSE